MGNDWNWQSEELLPKVEKPRVTRVAYSMFRIAWAMNPVIVIFAGIGFTGWLALIVAILVTIFGG